MTDRIRIPDPQHLELEALYDAIGKAVEDGLIDHDELGYLHENEPESVVFTGEYLDEAFAGDFDLARETVMAVGERDLDAKIRYWRREIDRINADFRENEGKEWD